MSLISTDSTTNLKPLVKTYVSITEYLKDYYHYRKKIDPKFSYEIWSSELGFKSKSSIRLICLAGKFISTFFIDSFSQNENLSADETEQLKLLANYRNCDDPVLKKTFFNHIIERNDLTKNQTQVQDYADFLSSAEMPILQLITSFSDVVATATVIQQLTHLEPEKIEESLVRLAQLGLIESSLSKDQKKRVWKSNVRHFKIESTVKDEAVNCFHLETTKEIAGALKIETALKKFRSIYFSLSDQTYTELSEDIEQFITKIKNKYANDYLQDKSLFKINIQAYPVTDKLK